ncbi:MAG: sulfotransferase [Elainellaceae cyanobacterium]
MTGSSRSGSTWVGSKVALSREVRYIYEPFNIDIKHKPGNFKFPLQFMYIDEHNELRYYNQVFNGIYWSSWKTKVQSITGIEKRPLIKDPIAIFSTEWLAKTFGAKVIITIRHPAGVVSSRKRLNWRFDFSNILSQENLIKDYLFPYVSEISRATNSSKYDVIDESILLWKIIYHFVAIQREKHPDWLFVRHEDICLNPLKEFKGIFDYLGLTLTDSVREEILADTSEVNLAETETPTQHSFQRNSRKLIKLWRDRLSAEEVQRIKDGVSPIYEQFYSELEW